MLTVIRRFLSQRKNACVGGSPFMNDREAIP